MLPFPYCAVTTHQGQAVLIPVAPPHQATRAIAIPHINLPSSPSYVFRLEHDFDYSQKCHCTRNMALPPADTINQIEAIPRLYISEYDGHTRVVIQTHV